MRDGFHPASPGGTVTLLPDGTPRLDYPLTPYLWEGARRAFAAMAEIQFAAGARTVMPVHGDGIGYRDWQSARSAIAGFTLAPLVTPVVSAHVMGGCPLGPDPRRAVVDVDGRQHQLDNLVLIIDYNKIQSLGAVSEVIELEPLRAKLEAFRWAVREVDGHNHAEDARHILGCFDRLGNVFGRVNPVGERGDDRVG